MAKIFVEGVAEAILVHDAPEFEEAVAMISELPMESMVVFPTDDSDVAVAKGRLLMFVQVKGKKLARQYVIPSRDITTVDGQDEVVLGVPVVEATRSVRKKRAKTAK